jgi:hypothetical protein
MSGRPGLSGGSLLQMTWDEAKEAIRAAAIRVDERLHGGQSGTERTAIIQHAIEMEFYKKAKPTEASEAAQ